MCITIAPIDLAPESAMALIVRSIFAGCVEKPGTIGAIKTPQSMPASTNSRTARSRCIGWATPGSSFSHASSSTVGTLMCTRQVATFDSSCSTSTSRTTIGPLVTMPTGVFASRSA